ncbi:MAG: SulP family inorganic anion transporter [Cyclobacteriaceae bacterium]|nr:SulP family inorganic anion transporter [Cyclobacteriaceae bacterium]MDH4295043.1 SulP family inorganic anion transporter [Cyclobacteriaceae bacterium]MDH5248509.1 SulP family inorganic anion transporter [Cyclobacteriaceae bacterium]
MKTNEIPKDGLEGFKQNWKVDGIAGFLVFLLALPLSLGIAKASEFPPAMGVLTAMIGGIFVSFLAGSRLTIKGPAAGLITICAGAVTELGGGAEGWHLALGVIVVAAIIQVGAGFLKFGSLSDFFPHSAVHGMLAAIGLIIFSKQIHILLGIDPSTLKGMEPIELYKLIPHSVANADPRVTLVGVISLLIIFGMPLLKAKIFKSVPAPMVVLLVTIPMALIMDFQHTEPAFDLVKIGDFWASVGFNADFSAIGNPIFWKYVFMFLFVNSLESLLTVKAIDGLDPWKRVSNPNKDLVAVGAGNALSGLLGGLPMISEVARSSANINFGGRTRWANFFHGFFLLLAMLLFIPVIEKIPNSALAALLIAVGYRLASPNEFFKTYKIGAEQLVIFVITIVVTVATDLLIGVGSGILVKFIFHILNGAPLRSLFKARYEFVENNGEYLISVKDAAIFSNLIGFKKLFARLSPGKKVIINFADARIVDHSFMEQLHHFEEEYPHNGGSVSAVGFEHFQFFSNHPLAGRKISAGSQTKLEIKLSPRQIELRKFAENNELIYIPQKIRNAMKYRNFPIEKGAKILYEENMLVKYVNFGKIEVSDVTVSEGAGIAQHDTVITVMHVSDLENQIPAFSLEPERLWTKLSELSFGKDIDFKAHPNFSSKYYLRGEDEAVVQQFFQENVIAFLESNPAIHIESQRNKLLVYEKRDTLSPTEIQSVLLFLEGFMNTLNKIEVTAV